MLFSAFRRSRNPSNLGLSNCLFVPCPRYLPSHRCAELPQRGSLRTAGKNLSGKGILLVLYERLSLWESSREAGERAIRREQAPALRRGTPPINCNFHISPILYPLFPPLSRGYAHETLRMAGYNPRFQNSSQQFCAYLLIYWLQCDIMYKLRNVRFFGLTPRNPQEMR